ncbi:MAG: sulfatase [Alphaproteobacteria bacterium]|nr:sulfatase [Alphaproteobacteria bacterium]
MISVLLGCVSGELPSGRLDAVRADLVPAPRNLLLIVVDDLAAHALGAYGSPVARTPHIDALADEGARFTRAYTPYPVCGPARAAMLTGYHPHGSGAYGYESGRERIGPDGRTWPQAFREAGFRTARVSKVFHMGVPGDIVAGADGTDDPESWDQRVNTPGPEHLSPGVGVRVHGNPDGSVPIDGGGTTMSVIRADGDDDDQADGQAALAAIAMLGTMGDDPFFLAVGLVRPHVPFVAPSPWFQAFDADAMVLPTWPADDWADLPSRGINHVNVENGRMSAAQQREALVGYHASVAFMDAQVGRILDALETSGHAGDTLVILTSDHGYHLDEHGFWQKLGVHEESVRVPLVVRGPGVVVGERSGLVSLLDLFPTALDLFGVDAPGALQGESLRGVLRDPGVSVRDELLVTSHGGSTNLLRSEGWAWIDYGAGRGAELYAMDEDPEQFHNLADEPAFAAIQADLSSRAATLASDLRGSDLR